MSLALFRKVTGEQEFLADAAQRPCSGWSIAAARTVSSSISSRPPIGAMRCGCPATGCTSTRWSIPICGCSEKTRRRPGCTTACTASPHHGAGNSRGRIAGPAAAGQALLRLLGLQGVQQRSLRSDGQQPGDSVGAGAGQAGRGDDLLGGDRVRKPPRPRGFGGDLPPCLFPFQRHGDWDYPRRIERLNPPGCYANGGIWPFVCGFYVAALVAAGRQDWRRGS